MAHDSASLIINAQITMPEPEGVFAQCNATLRNWFVTLQERAEVLA